MTALTVADLRNLITLAGEIGRPDIADAARDAFTAAAISRPAIRARCVERFIALAREASAIASMIDAQPVAVA